jgi:hypothetical protein
MQQNKIVCDYSNKLEYKLPNEVKKTDINEFLMFMNYSFLTKNDFFIENFNKKMIGQVYSAYNVFKTNIMTKDEYDLFNNISYDQLKMVKFIINNFIKIFDTVRDNHPDLFQHIERDSFKRFLKFVTYKMDFLKGE